MDGTLDSIAPVDEQSSRENMSYVYGRDPSILAYAGRPVPSMQQNLISLYEEEESECSENATTDDGALQTLRVYLRVKPLPRKLRLSKDELEAYRIANSTTLVTKLPSVDNNTSSMKGSKCADVICRNYTFTQTFGPETTQLQLFEQVIQQKMVDFLAGQNSTVMTYGTTNSGKSYTLQGTTTSPGIIPRGLEFVFSNINTRSTPLYKPTHNSDVVTLTPIERAQELESKNKLLTFASIDKHQYINNYKQMQKFLQEESPLRASQSCDAQYSVWVSFAEIYNENIYDLLSNDCQKRRPLLKLGTDNRGRGFIKGLKTICVNSGSEAYQVLMAGQYNLKVAATALNARSSRSHCIFTIKLLKYYLENAPERVEISTFSFCDLAGSERLKKTLNVGERLKEAQNINTSLLVLGRCLKSIYEVQTSSMRQKNEHVGPFRESKLTRLFQRALSGKEQIALIVNVNPVPNLYVETQNVLNFSAIAKKIVVEPKPIKRRVSNTRFSQMIAQSVKSDIDWDDTKLQEISGDTEVDNDVETSVFVHQDDYEDAINENKLLKKEICNLKASMLNRDLEIRQELADTYTTMMKKLESDWKNRIRDVEEQQEDQLEWSVMRVENFYKDKISELTSRKRRRRHEDNDDEDEVADLGELEIENSKLTTKLQSLKIKIKHLRDENKNVIGEKNKLAFELGLANDELKSVKGLLVCAQKDLCADAEERTYVEKLRCALDDKQNHVKKLKEFLNEAKEEYISITADASSMEKQLKDQAEQLAESRERIDDLEDLLKQVNECLAEQTKITETLDEQLSQQSKLTNDGKLREQIVQSKLVKSEETIDELTKKIKSLEKIISQSKIKILQTNEKIDDDDDEIEIKKELESVDESSLENSKIVFSEKIRLKNEISGDDRQSEMFVELREIIVDQEESDETKGLRIELDDCRLENKTLKQKCEQSSLEIFSLRQSLECVKKQLNEVYKKLEVFDRSKNLEGSGNVETAENFCQTNEILERNQEMQTSFVDNESDEKSVQTSFLDDEGLEDDRRKDLDAIGVECERLKIVCDDKEHSIEKLKQALENHESVNELKQLRIKYDELESECKEKEIALKKLETELGDRRDSNNSWHEKSNEDREKMEKFVITIEKLENDLRTVVSEKDIVAKKLSDTNELLKTLENQISKCHDEHEPKIVDLEKELTVAKVREETKSELIETQTNKIAEIETTFALRAKDLNEKIDELTKSMEICETDKKSSEEKVKKNLETIEALEKQIKLAEKKESEKDDEIRQLQKAIKNHLATDIHDKKMEKEMKQTLRELRETKEILSRNDEAYETLKTNSNKEIKSLEKQIFALEEELKSLKIRDSDATKDKDEIDRLKLENEELLLSINEKEREMDSFLKNRDEMIAKYETLVKRQQEESEQGKREITRLQEILHNMPTTPRGRGRPSKVTDENLKPSIPVVELSDSETKKTRRGLLAPPSICPTSDVKKNTRKKRLLYQPVDDSCIDLEISEAVPPTPSPSASTRSLRTRRNSKKPVNSFHGLPTIVDDLERNYWNKKINQFQWAINNGNYRITRRTPTKLVFNYKLIGKEDTSSIREIEKLNNQLGVKREKEKGSLEDNEDGLCDEFCEKKDAKKLMPGQLVMIIRCQTSSSNGKSCRSVGKHRGPYEVVKKVDDDRYLIQNFEEEKKNSRRFYKAIVSSDRLKLISDKV